MSMSIADLEAWADFNRDLGRTHASVPIEDLDWLNAMARLVVKYQGQPSPITKRSTRDVVRLPHQPAARGPSARGAD